MLKHLFDRVEEGKNAAAACKDEALDVKVIRLGWRYRFVAEVPVVLNIAPRLLLP